jgi:hypothetical protein
MGRHMDDTTISVEHFFKCALIICFLTLLANTNCFPFEKFTDQLPDNTKFTKKGYGYTSNFSSYCGRYLQVFNYGKTTETFERKLTKRLLTGHSFF